MPDSKSSGDSSTMEAIRRYASLSVEEDRRQGGFPATSEENREIKNLLRRLRALGINHDQAIIAAVTGIDPLAKNRECCD